MTSDITDHGVTLTLTTDEGPEKYNLLSSLAAKLRRAGVDFTRELGGDIKIVHPTRLDVRLAKPVLDEWMKNRAYETDMDFILDLVSDLDKVITSEDIFGDG